MTAKENLEAAIAAYLADQEVFEKFINDPMGPVVARLGGVIPKTVPQIVAEITTTLAQFPLSGAGIKALYEGEDDTNVFSDADKAVLANVSTVIADAVAEASEDVFLKPEDDLDDITDPSTNRWVLAPANAPFAYAYMIVANTSQPLQIVIGNTNGQIAIRRKNSGTWAAWVYSLGTGDLASLVDMENASNNSKYANPERVKHAIDFHASKLIKPTKLPDNGPIGSYRSGGLIMSDGTLRVWGKATGGNLGQGSYLVNRSAPFVPAFPYSFGAKAIKFVRVKSENFVLMDNGEVWSWGQNNSGVLGHGSTAVVNLPTRIVALVGKNVTDIIVSGSPSFAHVYAHFLTDTGEVYASGRNALGQLGIGNTTQQTTPVVLAKTDWARMYASGGGSMFGIDVSGNLFAWGYNVTGNLGLGSTATATTPVHVNAFGGVAVSEVSADTRGHANASGHTIALLDNGKVYTWGQGSYGQLGLGDNANKTIPQEVVALGTDNMQVFANDGGYGVSYVRKSDDRIFTCGYNAFGQLGQGNTVNLNVFTEMPSSKVASPTVKVLPMSNGSYGMIAILYEDGRIRSCGYNGHGQCGLGHSTNQPSLRDVVLPSAVGTIDICAHGQASEMGLGILTSEGQYYQTGYGGESQLPEDDDESCGVPFLVTF